MKFEEKRFRLSGTDTLLGSCAADKEVFTQFIVGKTKTAEERQAALSDANNIDENLEKGTTVFYRNDTGLIMKGYQVKGFLKAAAKALKDQLNLKNYLSKVDTFIFILEKDIPIMRDGEQITSPDGYLERPQRCETAQGSRVSLAKSEEIRGSWYIDITIRVVENAKTTKSAAIDMDMVEDFLDYGSMCGLLQWRNAGHGTFTWKEINE